MNKPLALQIARKFGIDLTRDYHALGADQVERIYAAAAFAKYRQPHNANGSKARYFHARLVRAAGKEA